MQNIEVKDTIRKIKKTKSEIKKELEESIAKGKRNENDDMQERVNGCTSNEDAVKAIQEIEEIIKNKKNDIIYLAYYQSQIFQKFKEKESFVSMVLKPSVSKRTIIFKIVLKKFIDDYSKIKDPSLSLHYF